MIQPMRRSAAKTSLARVLDCSCGRKRDTNKLTASLTVFETVRHNPERKSLNLLLSLFGGLPVRKHAREINDFSDPAAVFFLFNFHSKFM
jgi:hypothetical protein